MRTIALMAALVLSGCAGGSVDAVLSGHEHAGFLRLNLDDFASDAIALEVVPAQDGVLRLQIERSLMMASEPLQPGGPTDVCMHAQIGQTSATEFLIHAGDGIASAVAGEEADVSFGVSSRHVRDPVILQADVAAGVPVPVRVALHQAQAWADSSGQIDIEIRATGDFHHKRLPDPSFQCVTGPQHFEGGAWVDAGLVRSMQDQRVDFPVKSASTGVFIVSADHRYAFTFTDGAGTVVREDSLQPGEMGFNTFFQQLPPDTYTFELAELTGTNSVNFPTLAVGLVIEDSMVAGAPHE